MSRFAATVFELQAIVGRKKPLPPYAAKKKVPKTAEENDDLYTKWLEPKAKKRNVTWYLNLVKTGRMGNHQPSDYLTVDARIWQRYENMQRRDGLIDFDNMLVLFLQLLDEHGLARKRFLETYTHPLWTSSNALAATLGLMVADHEPRSSMTTNAYYAQAGQLRRLGGVTHARQLVEQHPCRGLPAPWHGAAASDTRRGVRSSLRGTAGQQAKASPPTGMFGLQDERRHSPAHDFAESARCPLRCWR